MRKWLGNLLIILLCIVLCVNVVRCFFVSPNEETGIYTSVGVFDVIKAFSEFHVDSTYLFNDLTKASSLLASVGDNFTSIFRRETYNTKGGILDNITRFFSCIMESFNSAYGVLVTFAFVVADVCRFVFEFFSSVFKLLNTILGSWFDTTERHYGGFSGGGYGGRR